MIENKSNLNPFNLHLLCDIVKDSYSYWCIDNCFIVFNSLNKILYLVYSSENDSIVFYNLEKNQKISEIKNSHKKTISNFRHYYDINNNRDLILSISKDDNNIRVWKLENIELILNLSNVNKIGTLCSACFLNYQKEIYIVSSSLKFLYFTGFIKIYDLKGNIIKKINKSNEKTYYIDTYYETNKKNEFQIYIITGNNSFVKSYNFNRNEEYYKYIDKNDNDNVLNNFESIVVNNEGNIVKLICCSHIGKILIWDFHKRILLNIILMDNQEKCFTGISLWDNNYLLAGSNDDTIKIIDIKKGKIIGCLTGHNKCVTCIKIIYHSIYGKCLLSQSDEEGPIKLWTL